MDFHEYWELIPNNEKYENIGQVSKFSVNCMKINFLFKKKGNCEI